MLISATLAKTSCLRALAYACPRSHPHFLKKPSFFLTAPLSAPTLGGLIAVERFIDFPGLYMTDPTPIFHPLWFSSLLLILLLALTCLPFFRFCSLSSFYRLDSYLRTIPHTYTNAFEICQNIAYEFQTHLQSERLHSCGCVCPILSFCRATNHFDQRCCTIGPLRSSTSYHK